MNWRIKGVTQKLLSALPGGVAINDLLQRTVGDLRNFEQTVHNKVHNDWLVLVGHMTELGVRPAGLTYVEIGTGWFPALPVCFHLAGAARVISFDLHRHLNVKLTERMIGALKPHLPAIAKAAQREVEADYARLDTDRLPFDYRAPADAIATGLPDNSVDVVFSNSVLEHVPPHVIARLMKESSRILRPGGLSIHSANCGDHYAYFDRNITMLNYLTYPARDWEFWNNRLLYQNRLRPQDFTGMAEQAGLEIALCKFRPREELLAALPALTIAPEFRQYPPEQLCSTSIDFVGRKP